MKRAVRDFELERDLDAVKRIWQEVGWVSDESEIAMLDHFFAAGRTRVGTPGLRMQQLFRGQLLGKTLAPSNATGGNSGNRTQRQ